MKLAQFSLILAVIAAGFAIALKRLGDYWGVEFPEITHFLLYAPAIGFGLVSWLARPSVLSHWSIVLWAAMPVLGMFYGESPSLLTSGVIAFYLLSGPALAALIDESRSWLRVARWAVLVNSLLVFAIFYLTYRCYDGSLYHAFVKFGYVPLQDGSFGANPNQLGGQLAFASVLGLALFFRSGRAPEKEGRVTPLFIQGRLPCGAFSAHRESVSRILPPAAGGVVPAKSARPVRRFTFVKADWLVILASLVTAGGCLMTGSRGAVLSLIIGAFVVIGGSAGLQPLHRLRDFAVIVVMSLLMGTLATTVLPVNPVIRLIARFSEGDATNIATAGSRLSIWENALRAWTSNPGRILVGTGTGGADVALGELDDGATWDDSGVLRRNCHNAFLEWLLSFGIVGLIPGVSFVLFLWLRASRLDHAEGATIRTGLLATIFAFGMTSVVYRHLCWPLEAGLMLALLCQPENACQSVPSPNKRLTQRIDSHHPIPTPHVGKTFHAGYQPSLR